MDRRVRNSKTQADQPIPVARKEKLVQPAVQQTEPAQDLEQLFSEHHAHVLNAAFRITGSQQDAEDVLQTVFIRLLKRAQPVDLSPSPGGYLHRAAVNAALDIVRSKGHKKDVALDDVAPLLPDEQQRSADDLQLDRQLRAQLRLALTHVSEQAAEMFVLRYFEGYGNTEIAQLLGTTRNTVAVVLHRTRHILKGHLGQFGGGDA